MEISSIIFCRLKYNKTLEAKSAYPVLKELVPNSPGNLSHFRANLETNCNSFYFSTVLFYEVPRMTY